AGDGGCTAAGIIGEGGIPFLSRCRIADVLKRWGDLAGLPVLALSINPAVAACRLDRRRTPTASRPDSSRFGSPGELQQLTRLHVSPQTGADLWNFAAF